MTFSFAANSPNFLAKLYCTPLIWALLAERLRRELLFRKWGSGLCYFPSAAIFGFDRLYFAQAPHVALLIGEFRAEESFHQILRQHDSHYAGPKHQHVDVIVLHALVRGISVVAHAGADAWNLVRRHAGADAAAANQHTALGFFVDHGAANGFREIRIVGGIFVERANIQHFMPQRTQQIANIDLQLKTGVIRANYQFHRPLTFLKLLLLRPPRSPAKSQTSSANPSAARKRRNYAYRWLSPLARHNAPIPW